MHRSVAELQTICISLLSENLPADKSFQRLFSPICVNILHDLSEGVGANIFRIDRRDT